VAAVVVAAEVVVAAVFTVAEVAAARVAAEVFMEEEAEALDRASTVRHRSALRGPPRGRAVARRLPEATVPAAPPDPRRATGRKSRIDPVTLADRATLIGRAAATGQLSAIGQR
jgi:hypothetical protein